MFLYWSFSYTVLLHRVENKHSMARVTKVNCNILENYFMSLTMCLGSFIAGATSEGGGAIAYPVMTLGPWKIAPLIARDFSLMIQSIGMIAAGAAISKL